MKQGFKTAVVAAGFIGALVAAPALLGLAVERRELEEKHKKEIGL